jgi:hypothetical protein
MSDSIATSRKTALPPPERDGAAVEDVQRPEGASPAWRQAGSSSRFRTGGLLASAVLPALLVSACGGSNSPSLPDVANGIVQIVVTPNPVVGSQSPLTGSVSLSYVITVTEINGLGGVLQSVSSAVFDPATGLQYAVNYFDSNDLKVFVGTDRIEPLGSLDVSQTLTYALPDLSVAAELVVTVQFLDDRGSLQNQSILVQVVASP